MPSAVAVGKKAPAFALQNQDGRTVKLGDFKGKWVVLYFYPRDSTPGCTTEACDFTAGIKGFAKLDAVVLGCSADSLDSHRKFIAKYGLAIDLLSDPDHAVMESYGAWGEKSMYGKKFQGIIRSTVIIDPTGKIAHHFAKVKSSGHAEQVRMQLEGLRAAHA